MTRRRVSPKKVAQATTARSYKVDGNVYHGRDAVAATHEHTPVFCTVRGNSDLVPFIVVFLDDTLSRDSHGKIPVHLVSHCPRCGQNWQFAGEKVGIHVSYLDEPVDMEVHLPDPTTGRLKRLPVKQKAVVSVDGVRMCPGDDSGGKGICGFRFRLRDNVLIEEKRGKL